MGGVALYGSEALLGQPTDTDNASANQYSFGADIQLKQDWFLAEALLLYSTGGIHNLGVYLDAGLVLDIAVFRLSLGAGQSFYTRVGDNTSVYAGLNAKASLEVMFGSVSVGISYIMAFDYGRGIGPRTTPSGPFGLNVLLWM